MFIVPYGTPLAHRGMAALPASQLIWDGFCGCMLTSSTSGVHHPGGQANRVQTLKAGQPLAFTSFSVSSTQQCCKSMQALVLDTLACLCSEDPCLTTRQPCRCVLHLKRM